MTQAAEPSAVAPPGDGDDPIREKLIAAAADVFAEKGYDGAGVAEIARRAGYTTGAIYGRFTGKAELLLAAIEHRSTSELDVLFNEHRFDGKVTDILTTVGSHLVTDERDDGALLLEAFVAARRDPDVRRMMQSALDLRGDRLADLVSEAQATGAIDPALDAEAVVRFCHAVGFGFLLFRAVELDLPDAKPWEDLIARLVDALDVAPSGRTRPADADQAFGPDPITPRQITAPGGPPP
ncbi:MAG: TetR/AcrR family transcriptional regulator [Acidimicrobiales bacterium]|nr:TetR/AcrR family transcriptional regulator [Acidimicrobiales bacterium]